MGLSLFDNARMPEGHECIIYQNECPHAHYKSKPCIVLFSVYPLFSRPILCPQVSYFLPSIPNTMVLIQMLGTMVLIKNSEQLTKLTDFIPYFECQNYNRMFITARLKDLIIIYFPYIFGLQLIYSIEQITRY